MPSRKFTRRIQDILDAIDEIQQFVSTITFDEFQTDQKTVKAVLYNTIRFS